MTDWASYWWNVITGPKSLTLAVFHLLRDMKNVCLSVPSDLPWRDAMRAAVETVFRETPDMENFVVSFIDVSDDCCDVEDIGRYILAEYADPDIAMSFRRRELVQTYIAKNHVIDNHVLWIKGMTQSQEQRWLQFFKDYAPITGTSGRIILELRHTHDDLAGRNCGIVCYSDYVKDQNLALFNALYLDEVTKGYQPLMQHYTATLCAVLCETDAEIAHALMSSVNLCETEPIDALQEIAELFPMRGEADSTHILSLVKKGDLLSVSKRIWEAQLQVFFPLIELEKAGFIKRYEGDIIVALQTRYTDTATGRERLITQFGEAINTPQETELGTLVRMNKLRKASDPYQYLLYIADDHARDRLTLLHSMRNTLAHGKVCSCGQIQQFIDGHPFHW